MKDKIDELILNSGGVSDTAIERKNLNFRTHLKQLSRRTICFSKDEDIHDNVIGMYIEKYYYKSGTFGDYFKNNKRA